MKRTLMVVIAAASLAACETDTGAGPGPSTGPAYQPNSGGGPEAFRDSDFAWSQGSGGGSIAGQFGYTGPGGKYTCTDVVLAPETPWSRARIRILYLSTTQAAMPAADVRERTPPEHSSDYARYARHASCDSSGNFSFSGLPNGSWYVITLAQPSSGPQMAVMRRVTTSGGVAKVTLR